jgi:hypothetical protein
MPLSHRIGSIAPIKVKDNQAADLYPLLFPRAPTTGELRMQSKTEPITLDAKKLRELASWYRHFAERAGNPSIWESRLRMAEDLEQEANAIEANRAVAKVGARVGL